MLQSSCITKTKWRQSAWYLSALPSGPAVPKEGMACGGTVGNAWNGESLKAQEAPGLHSEKLQRPGCWVVGGLWKEPVIHFSIRTPHFPQL